MYFGNAVDFYPVIETDKSASIFIPSHFPWEEDEKKAEIILNDGFKIMGTTDTMLIYQEDGGFVSISLSFSKIDGKQICILPEVLEKSGFKVKLQNAVGCDKKLWSQEDYTDKTMFCKKGMLSMNNGPYWGTQYNYYFADNLLTMGGRKLKIMRFSYCNANRWNAAAYWFLLLLNEGGELDFERLFCIQHDLGRDAGEQINGIAVFTEDENGEWVWSDLSELV